VITILRPVNGLRLNNTDPTTDPTKKKKGTGKSLYNGHGLCSLRGRNRMFYVILFGHQFSHVLPEFGFETAFYKGSNV
jgi:hypothetical protein